MGTTYSIWYGLSGHLIEYTPERDNPRQHSVRAYDIDTHTAYYIERVQLAQILRQARTLAHMSVAVYADRKERKWR